MSVPLFFPGLVRTIVSPIDQGINLVTTTKSTSFNVAQRVSPQKAVSWKVIAYGISSSIATSFNVRSRVHVKGAFFDPGIVRPIVWPLDVHDFIPQSSWAVDFRRPLQRSFSWRINQRRSSRKAVAFNIYNYEFAGKAINWRVLSRVHKPGVTVGFWVNEIVTPIVHPLREANFSPAPVIGWNERQRLNLGKSIRFNVRIPASARRSISWNTNSFHVAKQAGVSWNLKTRVSPKVAISWHLPSRRPAKKKIAWSTNGSVVVRKQITYRYLDKVSKSSAVKWNVTTRRNKTTTSRWNDLSRIRLFKQTLFKVLFRTFLRDWHLTPTTPGNIIRPLVWPVDVAYPLVPPSPYRGIVRTVVFPLSYPFYAGLQASPGIAWRLGINPNGRVAATRSSQFNLYVSVKPRVSVSWNTVGRERFKVLSEFNVYNLVSGKAIIEWNTGVGISGFIRQTAQQRTDFAF